MSSYKPLPKHKPHDVIPSEEWNIISDDLEYLKSKVEEALVGKVKPSDLDAIDSPADGEVPTYNAAQEKFEWKPMAGGGVPEIEVETSDWTLSDRVQLFPPPNYYVSLEPMFYTENAVYLWGYYYQNSDVYYIYKKVTWDGLIEDQTSDEITFISQYWLNWVYYYYVAQPLIGYNHLARPWGSIFGRYTLGMDFATYDKIYVARAKEGQPLQIIKTLQPIDSGKKFWFMDSQGHYTMFVIMTYDGRLIMALEAEDSYDTKDGVYLDVWKAV